jgi:hypothetical protein
MNTCSRSISSNTLLHQTLRVTPAMEAEISNHVWSNEETVVLWERRSILDGLYQAA